MAQAKMRHVRHDHLEAYVAALFSAAGSSRREAALLANHLVEANLRGHDSHGIGVIPMYMRALAKGGLVLNQRLVTALDTGGMLIFDAGRGMGQVMAHDAMALAINRAADTGSAVVSLRNSHHIGRIGTYAEQCAEAGMVSIHFVNVVAGAFVAPFGGTRARLGTNPFAAGFPRHGEAPLVIDFATSRLAAGKVRVAQNKGVELPPGALLDNQGRPTTDPARLSDDPPGSLVAFGEHKGSALMLACELLGAALVGAPTQHNGDADGSVINSMFSVVVAPERLGTAAPFAAELESVLAWFTSEGDGVRLPGSPELETRRERLARIPVDAQTFAQLEAEAAAFGLAPLAAD